jgi:hypothetical protein
MAKEDEQNTTGDNFWEVRVPKDFQPQLALILENLGEDSPETRVAFDLSVWMLCITSFKPQFIDIKETLNLPLPPISIPTELKEGNENIIYEKMRLWYLAFSDRDSELKSILPERGQQNLHIMTLKEKLIQTGGLRIVDASSTDTTPLWETSTEKPDKDSWVHPNNQKFQEPPEMK